MNAVAALGAVAVVIVVPALAAVQFARRDGEADLLEQAGYAYAGLAVSSWSIWVAALAAGLNWWTILLAPLAASAALVAGIRAASRSPRRRSVPTDAAAIAVVAAADRVPRRLQAIVWATAVANVLLVLVPFLPYGLHRADGVHRMGMTDWYKHLMVATALQGPAFPPSNPFLITGGEAPYYYGFHLIGVSVQRAMGGADPYFALLGLTLVTAAALPVVLFVVARGLFADARRAAVAAVGGTLLAGFDLVVWVLHAIRDVVSAWPLQMGAGGLRAMVPSTHLDFWIHHNERQFSAPYISLIWAPQHVAAVVIALLVIHVMRHPQHGGRGAGLGTRPLATFLLPALMLAALPAFSAYVAMALACGIVGSILVDAWRHGSAPWRASSFVRWRTTGTLGAVAALPVAWALAGGESGRLTIAVSSAGSWLNGAVFSALFGDNTFARLLDTPAVYLVELGVVGMFGFLSIRARRAAGTLSDAQREALTIAVVILVLVTVVRPPVGGPNNLYARPMLIVWSLLACFAADAWCAGRGKQGWRMIGVTIGLAGTLLGALGATAEGFAFWATPADPVNAARWINAETPFTTVVAADPERHNLGYWLRRRTVVADRRHALLFGATTGQYDDTLAQLRRALSAVDPVEAARRLAVLGADAVIVDSPPPAWTGSPCFAVGYRGRNVMVLVRSQTGCRETVGR